MKLTRRHTLTLAAAATAAAGLAGFPTFAAAKEGDFVDILKLMNVVIPDKVLGHPNAKVTVIEYARPTCPHCAQWSNDVLPVFKEKYIKTGQVKLIVRPFAQYSLDAAVFMLADYAARAFDGLVPATPTDPSTESSAPPAADPSTESSAPPPADPANPSGYSQGAVEIFDAVLSAFFRTQSDWATSDDPLTALKKVTTQFGFTEDAFNAALQDREMFSKFTVMSNQALTDFGLEGTPTFYINGKQLTGEKTMEQLSAEIDPLL